MQVTIVSLSGCQPVESMFELGLKKATVFRGKTAKTKIKKSSKHKIFVISPYH